MKSFIYDYFFTTYGKLDDATSELIGKYKDMSKSALSPA